MNNADFLFLPQDEELPVHLLAAVFKSKNQSYKLFWFLSILDLVRENRTSMTYDEIMNRMIAKAWYMVMEYHLNLGPADAIEIAINRIRETSGLAANEKEEKIISFLENTDDKHIKDAKYKLKQNVPYRLQKPFLEISSSKQWENFDYISSVAKSNQRVLYYYEKLNGQLQITINEKWIHYLQRNVVFIKGWTQYELIQYLQRRNPTIPGIPFKLEPPKIRDLKMATLFWKTIISNHEIHDCYTDKTLNENNFLQLGGIDIDHFIPWSYIASDEIWNLTPTFASVNRSKSNNLPDEGKDIKRLAAQHYQAIEIASSNKEIGKLLKSFMVKNLNNEDIKAKLYQEQISNGDFEKRMRGIIEPIYLSARNIGFADWSNRRW